MLSDLRLKPEHPSKVLEVLALASDASALIVKFVRAAKPCLIQPADIDMYALALAESSMLEAWQFQRSFPQGSAVRSRLVIRILEWCLSRTSARSSDAIYMLTMI
jgi:hypothetical protein